MTIVNLCEHTLNLTNADGSIRVDVLPSGEIARVATSRTQTGSVQGIPLLLTTYGKVVGLPAPVEGVIFVVSGMVAGHVDVRDREDVYSPGLLLRDADNKPIGCRGLTRTA